MLGKEKIEKDMENSLQNIIDKVVKWLNKPDKKEENNPDREENNDKD